MTMTMTMTTTTTMTTMIKSQPIHEPKSFGLGYGLWTPGAKV